MPNVTVRYTIEWSPAPKSNYGSRVYVCNEELFSSLNALTSSVPFTPAAKSAVCCIDADETDPIHSSVRKLFVAHGIDVEQLPGFRPSRTRRYENFEYDQFDYLSIRPEKLAHIAEFAENRDGVHVLKANARLSNKLAFASVEQTRVFYASVEGVAVIDACNLVGTQWQTVIFDNPEKASKKLFRLSSSITMPTCLTPMVDSGYRDIRTLPESEIQSRNWDNGGYLPAEMSFRRSEVEALGEFDVALTREVVGGFPKWYHPEVIVSQRFRQVLLKMKNTSVGFNPVHLV